MNEHGCRAGSNQWQNHPMSLQTIVCTVNNIQPNVRTVNWGISFGG